jgi:hypothetical protein
MVLRNHEGLQPIREAAFFVAIRGWFYLSAGHPQRILRNHEGLQPIREFVRRRSLSLFEDGSTSQRAIHKGFHETTKDCSQFVNS